MDGLFHLGKELHQQHAGDRSQSVFIKSKLAYHKTAFSSHRIGKPVANPVVIFRNKQDRSNIPLMINILKINGIL